MFFKKDIPAKDVGRVRVNIADLPAGKYQMKVYQVGYGVNDVYADYLKIGSPKNLSREQVRELDEKNNGKPVEISTIQVKSNQAFSKEIKMRENDVFLITLEKTK